MSDPDLQRLAEAAGIAIRWTDTFGKTREVSDDTLRALLKALGLPAATAQQCQDSLALLQSPSGGGAAAPLPAMLTCWSGDAAMLPPGHGQDSANYAIHFEHGGSVQGQLRFTEDGRLATQVLKADDVPPGYHRLAFGGGETTLAVAPRRCYSVADAMAAAADKSGHAGRPGGKAWGLAAQLYSLRRPGGCGFGDFTALQQLAESAAQQGASALAISPVHAMFSADPSRFSPYGPSSRLFLNVLHADPGRVLEQPAFSEATHDPRGSEAAFARLDARPLIDWPNAARIKLAVMRRLFEYFRRGDGDAGFDAFCTEGGQALRDHACYEALDAWLRRQQGDANQGDWRRWPEAYRNPRAATVQAFADTHAEEICFHQFLQWQAHAGLQAAQDAATEAGMAIGLIADLAVGADPGGSQAWGLQASMLEGVTVGAPPDLLAPQGQDWGLGALSPRAMREQGFAPWLDMLRANMRACGGIRIDHVLGLMRLWLVPQGKPSSAGAYLHYPLDDLLRLTALESLRHRAIVIGEDLGTVPPGFSEQLADAGILGIRALWLQREGNAFMPPAAWPAAAMATTSTHDLATIAGWWVGRDIDWRERLDLLGPEASGLQQRAARETERQALSSALQQAACATPGADPKQPPMGDVLAFVGQTPAELVLVPLEDVLGVVEQPNLPGTVDIHPNWQQRLQGDSAAMLTQPAVSKRLARLAQARGGATLHTDPHPIAD
ncbi:MAG: 4-alpha-glucanotransferase [Polaromonas sp.]|nr:4-alpha-glucanotransferase [Polaromonas sp.]